MKNEKFYSQASHKGLLNPLKTKVAYVESPYAVLYYLRN